MGWTDKQWEAILYENSENIFKKFLELMKNNGGKKNA